MDVSMKSRRCRPAREIQPCNAGLLTGLDDCWRLDDGALMNAGEGGASGYSHQLRCCGTYRVEQIGVMRMFMSGISYSLSGA